jgi:nucleolar protein 14
VDSSKRNAAEIESSKDLMAIDDDEALREEIKKDPPPVDNNAALPDEKRKKAPPTIPSEKEEALLDHAEKDYFDENGDDEDGDDEDGDDEDDDEVPAKDNGSPLKKKQKTDQEVLDIKDSSDDASVDDDDFVQDD